MRIHFFSGTDLRSRADFRDYYTLQNLKIAQNLSLIYFVFTALLRIIVQFVSSPEQKINHFDEYDLSNWIALLTTPFFYLVSIQIFRLCETDKKYMQLARIFVFLFAFFIITNAMRVTFYSMHNPRNTLVMYMLGLMIIAIFFTFEYFETAALAFFTALAFMFTLSFYQHGFNELFLNNTASVILLIVFFTLSRFAFSYRADNFLKLRAIEEKNIEIEKAGKVKNEILGVVAHDLRNPLSSISSLAMMMELDENMDADNRDNLLMIKASCDKANSIINDLIETAHNDTDAELELDEVEMNKFLLFIVDEWLKKKNAGIKILYYGTKKSVYALINKEKMQRAMDNLISNAVKFSGSSDHLEVILKELKDELHIEVKDFGVGIPQDLLPYIFDRFSKASRRGIRGEESIGLGLSIVRQIIRKHDGDIEVSSIEKSGTTFTIHLKKLAE